MLFCPLVYSQHPALQQLTQDGREERLLFGEAEHIGMNDFPPILITVHVLPAFLGDIVASEVVAKYSSLGEGGREKKMLVRR